MLECLDDLRPAPVLFVAFAGRKLKLGGIPWEFHRTLGGAECAAVYVRDPAERWYQYPEDAMAEVEARIRSAQEAVGAGRVMFLGASMGGYGALMFAARMNPAACLAFNPQSAVLPAVNLDMGDDRWLEQQSAIEAFPMGDLTTAPRPRSKVVLWVGAKDLDIAHARRLRKAWRVEVHREMSAGHDVARVLREDGRLWPLISQLGFGF